MPPKRVAENPPPSDEVASDEENDTVDDEEASDDENDTVAGKPNGAADDDEEGEDDNWPALKNSTVLVSSQKSDLASDSDSESTQPSPSLFTIKHHKPSLKPNKSGSKRPNESDSVKEAPNKKKNKGNNDDKEVKKGDGAIKGREVDSGVKTEEVKSEKKVEVKNHEKREEKGEEVEELWTKYPFLSESLAMEGISEGVKVILKEQLDKIEKGKLEKLERKWKRLRRAELELFVQRMELVQEIVRFTLDSIK